MRRLVQIFPSSWMEVWDDWEIRVVILYSLLMQMALTVMGNRRKYMSQTWARAIVWGAYLSADWAATFALGLLSDSGGNCTNSSVDLAKVMTAFWAPFFLLHLGGPDTITAYSLEDNELWLRNFLSVFVAFMTALYVFLKFWTDTLLDYAAIPIFVAGLTKCIERTLALRFASKYCFSENMIFSPHIREQLHHDKETELRNMRYLNEDSDLGILHNAYKQFMVFKRLCADVGISESELESSLEYLRKNSFKEAFKLVGIELGWLYDLRYTKARLTYTYIGGVLKFLSFFSLIVTFVVFVMVDKHQYPQIELVITWVLLVGAISLEFYAVAIVVSSDWFMVWLTDPKSEGILRKLKGQLKKPISITVPFLQLLRIVPGKTRWSGTMGQYELINFCRYNMPSVCTPTLKFFGIYAFLEKERPASLVKVPKELNKWIFDRLKEQLTHSYRRVSVFSVLKLQDVTNEFDCSSFFILRNESWRAFGDVEMDESILIWHIATDLCYNDDLEKRAILSEDEILRGSKRLSNYMLYLLVTNPSMLPKGIGHLRFRDTCYEARSVIKRGCSLNEARLQIYKRKQDQTKDKVTTSVLSPALFLTDALQSLAVETGWDTKRKWELISNIWIQMLCYAAVQCGSNEHAQQLRRGGELLTHVWLLMLHMGFTTRQSSLSEPYLGT